VEEDAGGAGAAVQDPVHLPRYAQGAAVPARGHPRAVLVGVETEVPSSVHAAPQPHISPVRELLHQSTTAGVAARRRARSFRRGESGASQASFV